MCKKFTLFLCFCFQLLLGSDIEYIRAYDLGGQGLKTALLRYDKLSHSMNWVEDKMLLGSCPADMEVYDWIRLRMKEVVGVDVDEEISAGYLFGFALAGLEKLRPTPLSNCDMSLIFNLPSERVRCIDDGAAHLIASLNSLDLADFKGPIWNFSLGTGVGWGFTNADHRVRNLSDFWDFFETAPWFVKEPITGLDVWIPCGSYYGFDKIVADNAGIVDETVFSTYALRWKSYIEDCILGFSTKNAPHKNWGTPVAIVFTGGHIDAYGDRLVNSLFKSNISIPVFTGPKKAGLLGTAWNTVLNNFGQTPLIKMIVSSDVNEVKSLLVKGFDVNERDALGNSPLSVAIKEGCLEIVELLIQNGAGINICDYSGQTPLCHAVRSNNFEMAAFLLEQGADANLCDYWNQAPIFFASQNKEIEKLLIRYGAQGSAG